MFSSHAGSIVMIFVVIMFVALLLLVIAVGVATPMLMMLSVMMTLVLFMLRHRCPGGRPGFGCGAFRDVFTDSCSGSTSHPGTDHSPSLASDRLANSGTCGTSGGTTDNRTGLAVTLGRRRGAYANDNCSGLATDGLPDHRARNSTRTAAHGGLGIAVSGPRIVDSQYQQNLKKIRELHDAVFPQMFT
jgi:hypothetical protein